MARKSDPWWMGILVLLLIGSTVGVIVPLAYIEAATPCDTVFFPYESTELGDGTPAIVLPSPTLGGRAGYSAWAGYVCPPGSNEELAIGAVDEFAFDLLVNGYMVIFLAMFGLAVWELGGQRIWRKVVK